MRKSKNQTILSFTTVLILCIVVGVIVWVPNFFVGYEDVREWVSKIFALLVTILAGTFIFLKNREMRFLKHETIFPFLFILLFTGLASTGLSSTVYTPNMQFNEGYIALICTSLAFYRLINQSDKLMKPWHCMECMLLLSAGSIFMPILWVYIPIFWIGMEVFNKFSLRNLFASIMGLIAPYLIAWSIIYLGDFQDSICIFYNHIIHSYTIELPSGFYAWASLVIFTISLIIALGSLFSQHDDRRYIHWINNFGAIILFVSIILNILFFGGGLLTINTAFWDTFLLTFHYSTTNNLFSKIYFWILLIASLGVIVVKMIY